MNWLDSTILYFSRYPGQLDICEGLSCPLWISPKESKRIYMNIYSYIHLTDETMPKASKVADDALPHLWSPVLDGGFHASNLWNLNVNGWKKKTWSLHTCSDLVLIPKLGSWHKHKNGTKERGREHDLSSIVLESASPFKTRATNLDTSGRMEAYTNKKDQEFTSMN